MINIECIDDFGHSKYKHDEIFLMSALIDFRSEYLY